jgi:lysylphosphatidylglycerol synthetase-like protein (DUF2156 family)
MAPTQASWRQISVLSLACLVLLLVTGVAEGWALGLALGLSLFASVLDRSQRGVRPGEYL